MPEALARADHDFVLRETARPSKSRSVKHKPSRFAILAPLLRRPGRSFLFASACVLLLGIGVNALFLQSERHPAPFFKGQDAAQLADPAPANIPLPPTRPVDTGVKPAPRQAVLPASTPAPGPKTAAPARELPQDSSRQETSRQAASPKSDPIAALLREGRTNTPVPPGSIPNPSAEQTKRILAVQEALKKLGHSVKPDGVAGPTTRVAIEAFERSRKLQVSGQMSPPVLRELAARSGVRIP